MKIAKCFAYLMLILFSTTLSTGVYAEQWKEEKARPIYELLATKTLISIDASGATQDGSEGWAVFCEGDPPTEFHCSNQFRAYGCSESCNCCYYEEFMKEDDRAKIQDYSR